MKVIVDKLNRSKILAQYDEQTDALMEKIGSDLVDEMVEDLEDVLGIFPDASVQRKTTLRGRGKARVWMNVANSDEFNFVEGGTSGSVTRRAPFLLRVREARTDVGSLKVKAKQPVKAEIWIPKFYPLNGTEARQWFRKVFDNVKKRHDKKVYRGVTLSIRNYKIDRAKV